MTILRSVPRSTNHTHRDEWLLPSPQTNNSFNGRGSGVGNVLIPAGYSEDNPNTPPSLPDVVAVPDQWVLSVNASGEQYLLRVENLTPDVLPLPPADLAHTFKRAWREASKTGFADRWALRDKSRCLATTAFHTVVRDHLQRPRSMIEVVVERISA